MPRGFKHLIVTMGDSGTLYIGPDSSFRVPAPTVDAVDTTGAGDAFVGCFAAHYAAGSDIRESIENAVQYASHSVTGRGTQTAYATREAFDEWPARA